MYSPPDDIPVLDVDPFSEETLANPENYQANLRDAGPLVWLSQCGFYATGRYDTAAKVLADWKQYSSARGVGTTDFAKEEPWWGERAVLIESDPPRHNEIRNSVMKVLKPKTIEGLAPEFRIQANTLLDRVLPAASFDAHKEIAIAYPLKVFGDALGIDQDNRENLLTFGDLVFNNFGPHNDLRQRSQDKADESGAVEWMQSRTTRDAVRAGSIGHQLHQLSDTDDLTPQESANVMRGQLAAGVDTTIAALSYLLYNFAIYPDQYKRIREDQSLALKAFEESVRLLSPIQSILRTTTADSELGGVPVRADHKIIISISAGNHDPRKWESPDDFDIDRAVSGHLGFGRGVHGCVGINVARLEADNLCRAFCERVKSISLTGSPTYKLNNIVRGFATLPVTVELV